MRISIGADHAGFELKQHLIGWMESAGHDVIDRGTYSDESVDYPPYCAAVGRDVAGGDAECGIVLGGSGQGEQIAANKVKGVRAALCNDLYTVRMAREHNDANVLSIGGRIVAPAMAELIVDLFLTTEFGGGRHERRVHQIALMEPFDLHEALYTTRAMRRLRPDPVPDEVVIRILDAAVRGPSSGNDQAFRFITVSDVETRATIATAYKAAVNDLDEVRYHEASEEPGDGDDLDPGAARVSRSSHWLADHLADVPLLLFVYGRSGGHSSTYPTGSWGLAERRPAHDSTFAERWGNTVEWRDDVPLWPRA